MAPRSTRNRRASEPRLASSRVLTAISDALSSCPVWAGMAPPLPSLVQKNQPRLPVRFCCQITRLTLPPPSSSSSVRSSNQTLPELRATTSTGLPTTMAGSVTRKGAPS